MDKSWLGVVFGTTLAVTAVFGGCGSDEDQSATNAGGSGGAGGSSAGGQGGTGAGAGGSAGATAGTGGGGTGGSTQAEICDHLDNDGDGTVDEDCPCTQGESQECYPLPSSPPMGCEMGSQPCENGVWGACTGVRMPAPGEDSCCTEIGANPTFEVYDAFLEAYPAANMPKDHLEIASFQPQAGDYKMKWSEVVPGDEIIDDTNGGIIETNIEAGRAFAREQAEANMPAGASIVATKEEPVIIEKLTGNPPCDGMGWAWGSLLYQMPDFSVGEMVYLYVGYCAGIPDADVEAFYYSEEPVVVCEAPIVK